MTTSQIPDNNSVNRLIFYPYNCSFGTNPKIDPLQTFAFSTTNNREESLNWHDRISEKETHELGLNKASYDQEKKYKSVIYKGFILANVGKIRKINLNDMHFIVEHSPENGNDAHCRIELKNCENISKIRIREIKFKLFNLFSSLIHV